MSQSAWVWSRVIDPRRRECIVDTDSPIVPEFNSWLEEVVKGEGSALHVKVGSPQMLRLPHGLVRLERDPLSPLETQAIADGIVPHERKGNFTDRGAREF